MPAKARTSRCAFFFMVVGGGPSAQRWIAPLVTFTRSPLRKSGVVSWVMTWLLPSSMRTVTR